MNESSRAGVRCRWRIARRPALGTGKAPAARRVLALALAAGVTACGSDPGPPENPFDDARRAAMTDSVRTTLDAFVSVIEAGEWGELAEFYADDPRFRWMEDGRVTYESRDAIVASLVDMGSSFTHGSLQYRDVEITPLAPGLAAFSARFEQRLVDGNGGGFSFSGVLGATLIHEPDGWKFLHGHTSTAR